MRTALLSVMLVGIGLGCRASDTPDRTKDAAQLATSLDFAYGVDAARPRTSFDLHIPPVGDAELYLGEPMGAEADTLGFYGTPVAPETRAALAKLVQSGNLLSRSAGLSATAEGSGFLRITSGSVKSELSLVAPDEGVNALRTKLDQILVELARHPLRTLRMTLVATREGETLRPEITLTEVGTEPLSVLFFDPADPSFCLQATASAGARTSELSRGDVAALVGTHALPAGVTTVPVGAVYHLPLAPLAAIHKPDGGAVEISGTVTVWLPGAGASRRGIQLRTRATAP
ncbi:MAG TPA: hypothetical protein VF316_22765 [Polyangiaceae bacterium]